MRFEGQYSCLNDQDASNRKEPVIKGICDDDAVEHHKFSYKYCLVAKILGGKSFMCLYIEL
jgi:hypothetical protein